MLHSYRLYQKVCTIIRLKAKTVCTGLDSEVENTAGLLLTRSIVGYYFPGILFPMQGYCFPFPCRDIISK
jgi:hypothetical protein